MSFTTQALASVAYQVGNLAGHTLRMLDLQAAALRQVEARVSTLGQVRGVEGFLHQPPTLQPHLGIFSSKKFFPAFLHSQMPDSVIEPWHFPSFLSLLISVPMSQCGASLSHQTRNSLKAELFLSLNSTLYGRKQALPITMAA